jgi:benzoate-CoA ligase family protein
MENHSIYIPDSQDDLRIQFSDIFNVAVPFIDRHLKEGRSEKVAIRTTSGEEVTYGKLAANVNRCGNYLKSAGLSKNDRLLMIVKDCPEFFYIFWGAIKAGIVPIPINTLLRAKDYRFIIDDSECAAVLYSPEYKTEIAPAIEAAQNNPALCICIQGEAKELAELIADSAVDLKVVETKADDDCFFLYSSGSTGNPKGAVHCHKDMVYTSRNYGVDTLGIKEDDVTFSAAKLFFAYGHGNAMHFPLWVGATTILFDGRPTPDTIFDTIEKFKPTIYFGVPTLYGAQLLSMEKRTPDLSSVRVCVSAGEALPPDLFKRWKEKTGLIILDGIGSTEILHIFISNKIDDYCMGSSGRMVPGYDAKILGDDSNPVKQGDSGKLWIKGGSTARCYWQNPEKTSRTMQGGWLNTGDTYYQDENEYYHYCGRNDDMLKVGGIWCSPFEIEAKLIEHPKVLEAAVVGAPDDQNLIKPKAYLILKNPEDQSDELEKELLQLCKKGLAPYKYPRWFVFGDDLPKTATGKIQRFRLR